MWKNFSPGFERVESRLGMVVLTYNLSYSDKSMKSKGLYWKTNEKQKKNGGCGSRERVLL
jgi:hypothetical protein